MRLIARTVCGLASAVLLFAQFQLNRPPTGQTIAPAPSTAPSAAPAPATPTVASEKPVAVEVMSDKDWIDSGIAFRAGDAVKVTADGEIGYSSLDSKSGKVSKSLVRPAGVARGFRDLMRVYPVNDAPRGALIGRFGDAAARALF